MVQVETKCLVTMDEFPLRFTGLQASNPLSKIKKMKILAQDSLAEKARA